MSLMKTAGPFNATNNTSDGYGTNCTDRWEHIKSSITRQEALPKEDINITMPITTARIQGNIYKAPHTANTRYKKHGHSKRIVIAILLFCFILQYTLSFWLWHRRCCGRHHTGDRPYRSSLVIYTGIQARIWIHLGMLYSTDEVTLHQLPFEFYWIHISL